MAKVTKDQIKQAVDAAMSAIDDNLPEREELARFIDRNDMGFTRDEAMHLVAGINRTIGDLARIAQMVASTTRVYGRDR